MDVVSISLPLLVGLIALALLFDFINGLHDAANSIATIVSTRVLRPQVAVAWAAFFNFIAFLFFGLHVARTVGGGIVTASVIDANVIFGALMGATLWNVITWAGGINGCGPACASNSSCAITVSSRHAERAHSYHAHDNGHRRGWFE